MRSRTSSCKARVFKKDLTRFAPIWAEYSALLLVIYYFLLRGEGDLSQDLSSTTVLFGWINALYGFVCAIGVFGYLTDPRECNTIHAFPIRREEYFLIHTLAGFVMALVPNALFFLLNLSLASGSLLPHFLFAMLEFTFFYGLAIFCMFLTGRKFAAATLYALFNWLSLLLFWALEVIYLPSLPGIRLNTEAFQVFTPLVSIMTEGDEQKKYIIAYAVAGLGLMIASLFLYRKRKLEYAGDFIAVKWLTPVFLAALSVACGCVLAAFGTLFDSDVSFFLLGLGLVIGYFTGMMLLRRTIRVFSLRSIGGAAALVAAIFLSIFVTELDPLGRVEYVPDDNDVASVQISNYDSSAYVYKSSDPAVIADVTDLHGDILAYGKYDPNNHYGREMLYLTYRLKNGQTVIRNYPVIYSEQVDRVYYYFSQPEIKLGVSTVEELKKQCDTININAYDRDQDEYHDITLYGDDADALLEVMFRECREGKMEPYQNSDTQEFCATVTFRNNADNYWFYVDVPESAADTIATIEELFEKEQ